MSRTHAEIGRLTRRLQAHVRSLDEGAELDTARRQDLLACLYGLHTLLELHYLQEDENYFSLVGERMDSALTAPAPAAGPARGSGADPARHARR